MIDNGTFIKAMDEEAVESGATIFKIVGRGNRTLTIFFLGSGHENSSDLILSDLVMKYFIINIDLDARLLSKGIWYKIPKPEKATL